VLGTLKNQEKLLELKHLSVSVIALSPKSKMTNTLLENSPIWATGAGYK
jgi:hypothetical protein